MTPVFMTEDLQDTGYGKCVGEDKNHLRVYRTTQTWSIGKLVGIGFGLGRQD